MIDKRATWHAVLGLGCLGVALMAPSPARLPGLKEAVDAAPTASLPQRAPVSAPAPGAALDAIMGADGPKPRPLPEPGPLLAYAREAMPGATDANPALLGAPPILVDITGLPEAMAASATQGCSVAPTISRSACTVRRL